MSDIGFSDGVPDYDQERYEHGSEFEEMMRDRLVDLRGRHGLDLDIPGIERTAIWDELVSIEGGRPWTETAIAGLQFYDYGQPGLSGAPISPALGDRLVLVRAPDNAHDANAVEVWWRNDIRIGHLPRELAADMAPLLDAGASCRAYVSSPGNGEPWSARALILGEAVRTAHDRHRAAHRPPPLPVCADLDDDIPF